MHVGGVLRLILSFLLALLCLFVSSEVLVKVLILWRRSKYFNLNALGGLILEICPVLLDLLSDLRLHMVELLLSNCLWLLSFQIPDTHVLSVELLADLLSSSHSA